jgi:hypothetical protein
MAAVLIRGEGIAGCCCARLLGGGPQLRSETDSSKAAAVMLSETRRSREMSLIAKICLMVSSNTQEVVAGAHCRPRGLPTLGGCLQQELQTVSSERPLPSESPRGEEPPDDLVLTRPSSVEHHFGSTSPRQSPAKLNRGNKKRRIESLGWAISFSERKRDRWLRWWVAAGENRY